MELLRPSRHIYEIINDAATNGLYGNGVGVKKGGQGEEALMSCCPRRRSVGYSTEKDTRRYGTQKLRYLTSRYNLLGVHSGIIDELSSFIDRDQRLTRHPTHTAVRSTWPLAWPLGLFETSKLVLACLT